MPAPSTALPMSVVPVSCSVRLYWKSGPTWTTVAVTVTDHVAYKSSMTTTFSVAGGDPERAPTGFDCPGTL